MRKLLLPLIAGATILASAASVANAQEKGGGYLEPGRYAWMGLKYGNARHLYEEKCAVWNWQQQSWYNICVAQKPGAPIAVKY